MHDSENIAMNVLRAANDRDAVRHRHWMIEAQKARARAHNRVTLSTRTCPGCGHALKVRVDEGTRSTMLICPSCNSIHNFPNIMADEGRRIGEEYTPGVTGRTKGKTVLRMGLDGKILSVRTSP